MQSLTAKQHAETYMYRTSTTPEANKQKRRRHEVRFTPPFPAKETCHKPTLGVWPRRPPIRLPKSTFTDWPHATPRKVCLATAVHTQPAVLSYLKIILVYITVVTVCMSSVFLEINSEVRRHACRAMFSDLDWVQYSCGWVMFWWSLTIPLTKTGLSSTLY